MSLLLILGADILLDRSHDSCRSDECPITLHFTEMMAMQIATDVVKAATQLDNNFVVSVADTGLFSTARELSLKRCR